MGGDAGGFVIDRAFVNILPAKIPHNHIGLFPALTAPF
jgi:hypothetical protein